MSNYKIKGIIINPVAEEISPTSSGTKKKSKGLIVQDDSVLALSSDIQPKRKNGRSRRGSVVVPPDDILDGL